MSYSTFGEFDDIDIVRLTRKASGAVTKGTDEGKAFSVPAAGQAKVGAANEVLKGRIDAINGSSLSCAEHGWVRFPYTGAAPTAAAVNKLECGAGGAVQVDAANGADYWVEDVDTTALTCLVYLP